LCWCLRSFLADPLSASKNQGVQNAFIFIFEVLPRTEDLIG